MMRWSLWLLLFLAMGCGPTSRWSTATPRLDRLTLIPTIMGTQHSIERHITLTHQIHAEGLEQRRWGALQQATSVHNVAQTSLRTPMNECGALPPDGIDESDASDHIDEEWTVQGRVVKVGRSQRAVFLNFHDPYQGHFSGVIFISAWKHFSGRFEDLYQGQCVRIRGTIKLYNGAPEIIIERPEQIILMHFTD